MLTEDSWKDGGVQRPGLEAGLHLAGGGGGVPAVLLLGPHHRPHDQGPQHHLPGQVTVPHIQTNERVIANIKVRPLS